MQKKIIMNEEEEYIEFSSHDLEAIQAGIKEELFEIKQYVLQKAPIMLLFNRKIMRLRDLIAIQSDLFPDELNENYSRTELTPYESDEVNALFSIYFANKNKLKHAFISTSYLHEAIGLMEQMCANEKLFGELFHFLEVPDDGVVSKEPDPMDVHEAIQELMKMQLKTIDDVKNHTKDIPTTLLSEMKRLSLLAKKY